MNLDYKILWIDDNLQSYIDNNSVKSIEEFLSDRGFEPIIETVVDESDVIDESNKDNPLFRRDYDVIISDFNLLETNGDKVIRKIRDTWKIDADILLYSAKTDYKNDSNAQNNLAFIDRVTFHFGRETLLERIEELIELTLRKLLELNATRGLITAATSYLDVEIEHLFFLLIDLDGNKELKQKIENIFITDCKETEKYALKKCQAKRDCHTSDYKQYFSLSESFRKFDILKELLKLKNINGFDLNLFKQYGIDVIDVRNKFAHAKAEKIEGRMVLKGRDDTGGFEFDETKCIEIRKSLIAHKNNISALKKILSES